MRAFATDVLTCAETGSGAFERTLRRARDVTVELWAEYETSGGPLCLTVSAHFATDSSFHHVDRLGGLVFQAPSQRETRFAELADPLTAAASARALLAKCAEQPHAEPVVEPRVQVICSLGARTSFGGCHLAFQLVDDVWTVELAPHLRTTATPAEIDAFARACPGAGDPLLIVDRGSYRLDLLTTSPLTVRISSGEHDGRFSRDVRLDGAGPDELQGVAHALKEQLNATTATD